MAADVETAPYIAARLGAHELVLLHGQPGSAADWLRVAGRLPAGGFAANARRAR
jgi:pimeloyl-ACP methyl ester carboxylesterase